MAARCYLLVSIIELVAVLTTSRFIPDQNTQGQPPFQANQGAIVIDFSSRNSYSIRVQVADLPHYDQTTDCMNKWDNFYNYRKKNDVGTSITLDEYCSNIDIIIWRAIDLQGATDCNLNSFLLDLQQKAYDEINKQCNYFFDKSCIITGVTPHCACSATDPVKDCIGNST